MEVVAPCSSYVTLVCADCRKLPIRAKLGMLQSIRNSWYLSHLRDVSCPIHCPVVTRRVTRKIARCPLETASSK
jgi:hypothetical protein